MGSEAGQGSSGQREQSEQRNRVWKPRWVQGTQCGHQEWLDWTASSAILESPFSILLSAWETGRFLYPGIVADRGTSGRSGSDRGVRSRLWIFLAQSHCSFLRLLPNSVLVVSSKPCLSSPFLTSWVVPAPQQLARWPNWPCGSPLSAPCE